MNLEKEFVCDFKEIPFGTSLNFLELIKELKDISESKEHPYFLNAIDVIKKVNKNPELLSNSVDDNILKKHADLIRQMMSFVINPMSENFDSEAIYEPFNTLPFYANESYFNHISNKNLEMNMAIKIAEDQDMIGNMFQAFITILKTYYHFNFTTDTPFTYKVSNKVTGEEKFYIKKFNIKYLNVIPKKEIKKLSDNDIQELFNHSTDLKLWNKKIPLADFEFSGFIHCRYINVTHDYVMSELKSDLIDKNTILSKDGFNGIIDKVRILIDNHDIAFGISARPLLFSEPKRNEFLKTTILKSKFDFTKVKGSIYEKAILEKQVIITNDFEAIKDEHPLNAVFLEAGIKSHAVVPLFLDHEIVGIVEFGCKIPNAINKFQILTIYDIFPIFALALKRSREEWSDRLQAIMQKNFTAIHPTVEWRFKEAAAQVLTAKQTDTASIPEPIIFENVIPLYGASDIKNSSIERNKAIRFDLQEQLNMAQNILVQVEHFKSVPIINDLVFKIEQHLKIVKSGLNAGDEVCIVEFLKNEITPIFDILKVRFKDMKEPIDQYFSNINSELGILYKRRKDFEESITLINDTVSAIIDKEQSKAQDVFPHYFEKYRTDGIEYDAYIGQSLVKELAYNDIYLRNLRLWQLLVKVKVARKINQLQPELKTKLNITQLILIHSNPLSIEFRQDEKKFDVAGAYNIRYEITKKRIDKALIKGSKERITQVGKIAIIYSYANEIVEYQRFIDYMVSQGFITNNIEYLDLENLKGATGLHALRIEVDFSCTKETDVENHELIQAGL